MLIFKFLEPANLLPGSLGSIDIAFAIERDVAERISVQELDSPVQDANQTPQDAEECGADQVTIGRSIALSGRADLTQKLDDGDKEASETDTAETVRDGALEGTACGTLGHGVRREIPGAVYTGDRNVDGILEPSSAVSSAKEPRPFC
jgi:hypothetical protein